MIFFRQLILIDTAIASLLCFVVGCNPNETTVDAVLPVGVIVSEKIDGPTRARDTIRCSELIANAYNRAGGVLIDGIRYQVDLKVVDYGDDSMQAIRMASHLIHNEGVRYFIGPDSGDSLDAVTPLYQAAGALFVHSDMSFDCDRMSTLGLRGSPRLGQSLELLCGYLKEERAVQSIAVVAGMQSGAIAQKIRVEELCREFGFSTQSLARYDVREEVYNHDMVDAALEEWCRRLLVEQPDAILLCGFFSEIVPSALQSLKELNYSGEVVVLDGRGPKLSGVGVDLWEGVLFLGGLEGDESYSKYYWQLRRRGEMSDVPWSVESTTKLYALETLLLLLQAGDAAAVDDPRYLLEVFERHSFAQDPFCSDGRSLRILGEENSSSGWQIQVPVFISEVVDGAPSVVRSFQPLTKAK